MMRVFACAFIATAHEKPRRRARAFLDEAARLLAEEDALAALASIRPQKDHAAVAVARRQALAWFRALTPTFVAKLPSDI